MIRFEVEIGHLLDVKQKEGHIWSSGELLILWIKQKWSLIAGV